MANIFCRPLRFVFRDILLSSGRFFFSWPSLLDSSSLYNQRRYYCSVGNLVEIRGRRHVIITEKQYCRVQYCFLNQQKKKKMRCFFLQKLLRTIRPFFSLFFSAVNDDWRPVVNITPGLKIKRLRDNRKPRINATTPGQGKKKLIKIVDGSFY